MAFFLKKSKQNNRTAIAIYESFYSHKKKGTSHKCYKSLGSVESQIKKGIADPISHFQKMVDDLNERRKKRAEPKITEHSVAQSLGYFPLKSVLTSLKIKEYINVFHLNHSFQFNLFELLSTLVYARVVNPCSKRKTFHDVLPTLFESYDYSYNQLLEGLEFFGENYRRFVDLFTEQVSEVYGLDGSKSYFDCTNFYFEIDREDDFRRKGPSKENRKDPIVGLGLLLDANQVPINMRVFPGNESEKPFLREAVNDMKRHSHMTGRTIHVADKGLNCAQNIAHSKLNDDGYLFSKSVLQLPQHEKAWVLNNNDWVEVKDKAGRVIYKYKSCVDQYPYTFQLDGEATKMDFTEKRLLTFNPSLAEKKRFEINKMIAKAEFLTHSQAKKSEYGESGKYVNFSDKDGKKAIVSLNQEAIEKDLQFAGYNLLVTSETKMSDQDIYSTYHNLWRIEESFRVMKSDLDARPVFVQKQATITGHFFICYLAVLLERLIQFKILNNKYSSSAIYEFMKGFRMAKVDNKYINLSEGKEFIVALEKITGLPLTNCKLSETQIKSVINYQFPFEKKK